MSDRLYTTLGRIIRAKRQERHLSQKELGDRINYSQQAISRFEAGERELSSVALFSMANELGCSADEFNPFDSL